jgi:hypothetical protein
MQETFRTRHGTTVAVMATADTVSDPRDWGALVAFHHWRDFMRGHSMQPRNRPVDAGYRFPEPLVAQQAIDSYRLHWRNSAFREATR